MSWSRRDRQGWEGREKDMRKGTGVEILMPDTDWAKNWKLVISTPKWPGIKQKLNLKKNYIPEN